MKKHISFIVAGLLCCILTGCTSFEEVKQQADNGNADMQFRAAMMLLEGDGIAVDRQAAEKYLTSAIKAKNPCFNSPAACSAVFIYVISLSFSPASQIVT